MAAKSKNAGTSRQKQRCAIAHRQSRRSSSIARKSEKAGGIARKSAGRRRNPDGELEAAAQLTSDFHGRPADRVTVVAETEAEHAAVAELGRLLELHVRTPEGERFMLPFYNTRVKACSTPDGLNIVFVGGDQEIGLESLGLDTDKEQLPLGECTHIVYHTSKAFHNFEPTDYVHEFGEESGVRPTLGYSTLNQRLYLEGGRYAVRPEGITD